MTIVRNPQKYPTEVKESEVIPMYDELIKNLRHDSASALQNCEFDFVHSWMLKAADAIEELQKQLREEKVDNVNLTGWLAEEHAKAEDFENKLNLWRHDKISRWIPVTERLPEEDGKYLTVHTLNSIPPKPWIEVCWFAKDLYKVDKYDFHGKKKKSGFYQYDSEWGNFERTGISHWMPLPEPPKDGEA